MHFLSYTSHISSDRRPHVAEANWGHSHGMSIITENSLGTVLSQPNCVVIFEKLWVYSLFTD